jgi:tryptophan-rich sensory protein
MKKSDWFKLIISIVICQLTGAIGAIFTAESVGSWYLTLNKPGLNPPSWVFAPVWTTLYVLMGVALFIIWKKHQTGYAIHIFIFQLILNSLWSFLFFGVRNIQLAFIEIILLWLSILITIILFYRISRPAAYLLIPYILWVTFASYLNYELMRLN